MSARTAVSIAPGGRLKVLLIANLPAAHALRQDHGSPNPRKTGHRSDSARRVPAVARRASNGVWRARYWREARAASLLDWPRPRLQSGIPKRLGLQLPLRLQARAVRRVRGEVRHCTSS